MQLSVESIRMNTLSYLVASVEVKSMILKCLCIANLYTYRLNAFTVVKNILFSYCLLTSLSVKAAPDDNIYNRINIDTNEEK